MCVQHSLLFFLLLKIPSVTGSCSHPTGVGLGAVLFGHRGPYRCNRFYNTFIPVAFTAHGGLTTIGANVFSMQ